VNDGGVAFVGIGALAIFIGVSVLGPVIATPVVRVLGAPLPRLKGMTGVLARENALRNPKRTSSTAAALMIGVALVGFITVFASSAKASINSIVDDRFKADLIVDSGSFGGGSGLPVTFVDDVRKLPEVEQVSGVRAAQAKVDGKDNFIFGFDPATIAAVYDVGVLRGSFGDLQDGTIALQEDWAKSHHKSIGDTVDVQLVEGGVQHLTVRMLYEDNVLATNYFIPLAVYDKGVPDATDAQVYLTTKDGVSPTAARAAVEKAAKPYPTAKVQDLADFKASQSAQFNVLLGLIYVLLLLAIIIALLGIANTLALSVFERTRELGLLRAVGMTRRQVRSSIRWESVVIALLGTVLGLVIGLFFGWAMSYALKDQGFTVFSVPITQLFVIALLAAVAGVIAAIWPARRASRLNVLAAIATE
jgi:putative ABC transport system permease protein